MTYSPTSNYSSGSTSVEIINQPVVFPYTSTSVNILVDIVNMSATPTSYSLNVQRFNPSTGFFESYSSSSPATNLMTVTGLVAGDTYRFTVIAYIGASTAQSRYVDYTMPLTYINNQLFTGTPFGQAGTINNVPGYEGMSAAEIAAERYRESGGISGSLSNTLNSFSTTGINLKIPSKSYLELSVSESQFKANQYAIAYRSFPAVVPPSYTTVSYAGAVLSQSTYEAASTGYYSFGTSMFMKNSVDNQNAMGGVGFFINSEGTQGYYVIVETTNSAASFNRKSVRIVKFYGNNVITLKEIGVRTESTIEGLYGGRLYNIDIKVKVSAQSAIINAYINGYKITYTDSTTNNTTPGSIGLQKVLQATNNVALLCGRGTVAYDYIYGNTITKTNYDDAEYITNLYQGQFNNDLINTSFGDLIYTDNDDEIDKKLTSIDEFGTVVREIVKSSIKFDTRPAYPILWSTGSNINAKILGSKLSSFGADCYVLNNTSTTIPLQDNAGNSLFVYGNSLGSSGTLEYVSNELAEYANPEPVIFQSKWLQNLADVKSLADWIKSKTVVVNRGRIVKIKVFGNPLISVGDIVSIKHTYLGLAGTESFIVTNVNHDYAEGLETSITCRSL